MEYKNIIFEKRDGIGYVTMNRERALNALNTEVLTELDHVFCAIDQDEEVKIAIITGKGRAFIAGADIGQMAKLSGPEGRDMTIQGQQVMERIESITKPVIAAINGFALGGGNELSMACDIRIASEKAKFGQPEVNLGIIPGYGGTQRLPRLVGKGMAKMCIRDRISVNALGKKYDELGVDRAVLSRSISDGSVVLSPIVPWCPDAMVCAQALGVATLVYAPYYFMIYGTIVAAVVCACSGIGMKFHKAKEYSK